MLKLLNEGLLVTVFAMAIVFIVLIILSYIIKAQTFIIDKMFKDKPISNGKAPEAKSQKIVEKISETEIVSEDEGCKIETDELELVAVLMASICAYTGKSSNDFRINSIKRTNSNYSTWRNAGIIDRN